MEKSISLSVEKMRNVGFNPQEIENLIKKSERRLGFVMNFSETYDYHYNDKKFEGVVGQTISSIHPDCFLNKMGLRNKDILLSIGQYAMIKKIIKSNQEEEKYFRVDLQKEIVVNDLTKFELNDGDKVSVYFLRPKPHMLNPSQMDLQRRVSKKVIDNYDFIVKTGEFNWSYEIENTPEINTRVEMTPIKNLSEKIRAKLFNQDHAIDKVVKVLKINAAGLKEENKPIGSFLFTGPTGVGKTELAKLLSQEMNIPLFRVDMSEFGQEHAVSRFLGSPAGYVGYTDESYLLTTIGNDKKKCILLLDEMEKAHDKIQTLFLQAMDNAKVTLSNNKEIDLSNTLIIMTSNCGVIQKNSVGLTSKEEMLSVSMEQIKEKFLPEFIGRLSGIVDFNPLNEDGALLIIDKLISEFNQKMKERVSVKLNEKSKQHILAKGFNKTYGARPLKQYFSNQILVQVADMLLEKNGNKLGDLNIEVENDQLLLKYPPELTVSNESYSAPKISVHENESPDQEPSFFQKLFNGIKKE